MSVLSFPRMYLTGEIGWDPVVSNNDLADYDVDSATAVAGPDETVAAARERFVDEPGDWNYYGTHRTVLRDVVVVGGALGPDSPASADDPLLSGGGAPVELTGKLVDIDPTGILSQVFFDEFTVGLAGRAKLRATPLRRMSSRWVYFLRNQTPSAPPQPARNSTAFRAAATWQAVFPTDGLDLQRTVESPLLQAFGEALQRDGVRGLMLRLCTYRTQYYRDVALDGLDPTSARQRLADLHRSGTVVSNPAVSMLVGSVGLWLDGDAEMRPGGRLLRTAPPPPPQPPPCGPAVAEFDRATGLLSLDLSPTIPEDTPDGHKKDLGALEVRVRVGTGAPTIVATLDYARYRQDAYEGSAGIVDVPVPESLADAVESGDLEVAPATGDPLTEVALRAWSEDANLYMDQSDPSKDVVVQVRDRGRVPAGTTHVQVTIRGPEGVLTPDLVVPGGSGSIPLTLEPGVSGVWHLIYQPYTGGSPPSAARLDPGSSDLTTVRMLPHDDEWAAGVLAGGPVPWDVVHRDILRTYEIVTPRMSNVIDFSDPDAVRTFARRFLEVTDPSMFESARYMPVTRDLSAGKRRVLRAFCARFVDGVDGVDAAGGAELGAAPVPRATTLKRAAP